MHKQGGLCYRSCSKINMIDCSIDSCVTKPDFCYLIIFYCAMLPVIKDIKKYR